MSESITATNPEVISTPIARTEGVPIPESNKAPLTPATPHVEKTIPNPDVIHAKILETLKEKYAAKPPIPSDKPTEAPPEGESKPADGAPTLKTDPKTLRELGRLQTNLRAAEAKAKEFESYKADGEATREMRKLWSGDGESKLKALAMLSGKDGLDELAHLVQFFYTREQGEGAEAQPSPAQTNESRELLAVVTELKKEIAELRGDKKSRDEVAEKEASAAANAKATEYVQGKIKAHADKFEIMNRPENLQEAASLVRDGVWAIAVREGVYVKDDQGQWKQTRELSPEEAEDLHLEAMQEVEQEYVRLGKQYGPKAVAATSKWQFTFDPGRHVKPLSRPAVTPKPVTLSKNPDKAFRELQAHMAERAAAGGFRRGI